LPMSVTRFNPRAMFVPPAASLSIPIMFAVSSPVGAASTLSGVPLLSHANKCSSSPAHKFTALECRKNGIEIGLFGFSCAFVLKPQLTLKI